MSEFILREATEADYPDLLHVWEHVYGNGHIDEPLTPPESTQAFFLGRVDGKPAFGAKIHDFPTVLRGEILGCAGIGAVGTLGEYRGQGVGQLGMEAMLSEAFNRGYALTNLYAVREWFYRKSGYATCGWRWNITVPVHLMPKLKAELPIRQIKSTELDQLHDCFEAFIQDKAGAVKRNDTHWKNRMGMVAPVIYAVGDPVEGYFWCNPEGFYNTLELGEFVWSTQRGYRSLLAHAKAMAINKSDVSWQEPDGSPLINFYFDKDMKLELKRNTMYRIVNVESTLAKLGLLACGLKFDVSDPIITDNNGVFGRGDLVIKCDVSDLTLAVMGQPDIKTLVDAGRIIGSDQAIASFEMLLPKQVVYCTESF
ncbi:MAG: GNAT family N-acetyltransferase [Armatimonadetes bacterium]|nr:GNAT family N-acetyltransferase [Armatimonadota bacterium]